MRKGEGSAGGKRIVAGAVLTAAVMVRILCQTALAADGVSENAEGVMSAAAEESQETGVTDGEVVFLLDASASMNRQDKDRLAIDAVRQGVYSLPGSYRAGFVAYNTKVQAVSPLESARGELDDQLNAITYTGYTDAGHGLEQAVELFSEKEGVERLIVMLSDGEIDMPDAGQRDDSRAMYTQAVNRAREKGIKICIIAVGSGINDPRLHIFDGAEQTNGSIYWEGQSGSLSRIIDRIVTDKLSFSRQAAGVSDAGGGNVHVEVPEGVERFTLLLTSEAELGSVRADYRAGSGQTVAGKHFAAVEMIRPSPGAADLYFETSDLSGARAGLVAEFTVRPELTVTYRSEEQARTEEEVKKNIPPRYVHWADIAIGLADTGGSHGSLWEAEGCEGMEIPYVLNGIPYTGVVRNGRIENTIPADGINRVEVTVDTGGMEGIYHVEQPVSAEIVKYPDPEFEPATDYRPLAAVMGALAAALIFLVAFQARKRNAAVIYVAHPPVSNGPARKIGTKTCSYSGKINMYVVRTADGRDIPPQTYRLFGRSSGRMTLDQILTSCGIRLRKIGAEDIIFYPGPEHSLIVMDQSERCTTLRGAEILKKGMGYPVYYGEKVTITFEDEATELEIHYRALKPGEREGI